MTYETLLYECRDQIAFITFNRPDTLNTIIPTMADELADAVSAAGRDRDVKVIVLRGAGRAFCAGFNFGEEFSSGYREKLETDGQWDPGKDLLGTTSPEFAPVPKMMSLWHSPKPVIAQVHGWCVGGGSDMALCADLVIASDDAQIGTPYARMWGCYLSGMWIYRLGLTRARWHSLLGEPLSGAEAAEIGLINRSVPFDRLEQEVMDVASKLASLPYSQLYAMKLIVSQAYENMGLASTQLLGPVLDGYMRNTPDARAFVEKAATEGVASVLRDRDGLFADYSQASPERQPSRDHVIVGDRLPPRAT